MLTADLVEQTFVACLFRDNEPVFPRLEAEGIVSTAGFHPGRIAECYDTIVGMLEDLPDPFQQAKGGGWSFLNACLDKDGNQWANLHCTMEHLFQLGIAAGRVMCPMPRDVWMALPGGVPYYVVTTNRHDVPVVEEH